MGLIYRYECSDCERVKGDVYYGVGKYFKDDNIETRLFGCTSCGEVFSGNINDPSIVCPECGMKPKELKLIDLQEPDSRVRISMVSKCPNCKKGIIRFVLIGFWD